MAPNSHASRFRQRKGDEREISLQQIQPLQDVSHILGSIARAVVNNNLGIDAAATEFLIGNDTQGLQPNMGDVLQTFQDTAVSSLSFDVSKPITVGVVRYRLARAKDAFAERIRSDYPADALNGWYHEKSDTIYTALEVMFKVMCDRIENRMNQAITKAAPNPAAP